MVCVWAPWGALSHLYTFSSSILLSFTFHIITNNAKSDLSLSVITGTFSKLGLPSLLGCVHRHPGWVVLTPARSVQAPLEKKQKMGVRDHMSCPTRPPSQAPGVPPHPLSPPGMPDSISGIEELPAWIENGNPGSWQGFPSCKGGW